jgi:hypothetical protein
VLVSKLVVVVVVVVAFVYSIFHYTFGKVLR